MQAKFAKLSLILLAGVAIISCYASAHHARQSQTDGARGMICMSKPQIACPGSAECSGYDRSWYAKCTDDGKIYKCGYVDRYGRLPSVRCGEADSSFSYLFNTYGSGQSNTAKVAGTDKTLGRLGPSKSTIPAQKASTEKPLPLPSPEGYRNFKWGMKKAKVREKASTEIQEKDGVLYYKDRVAGVPCIGSLIFVEEMLSSVSIMFISEHTNKNTYLEEYYALKTLLKKKYGAPIHDRQMWTGREDTYKNDPQSWGLAVSMGFLKFITIWETKHSGIGIMLSGENFKPNNNLNYWSKALKNKASQITERRHLQDL